MGRVGCSNGGRSNGKKVRGGQNNSERNYRRTLAYGNNYDIYDPRARPDMYAAANFPPGLFVPWGMQYGGYSMPAANTPNTPSPWIFLLMVALIMQPRRCTHT
jgi:hypothetical protein